MIQCHNYFIMVCGDKVLVLTVGAGVLLVDVPPAVSAVKHGLATDRRMGKSFSIRLSVTMLARWLRMPAVSAVKHGLATDRRMG